MSLDLESIMLIKIILLIKKNILLIIKKSGNFITRYMRVNDQLKHNNREN